VAPAQAPRPAHVRVRAVATSVGRGHGLASFSCARSPAVFDRGEAATLESIGLAPTEALAYRTMLRSPTASIEDLATRLRLPILDVRTALRGLEAKGLIGRIPGSAQRFWLASAPDDAFRPLVRQRRAELRAMRSDVDVLTEEYRNRRQRPEGERVDVLYGNAATHVTRLVAGAAVEVCALVTDRARALPARGRAARRPGVRVRAVYSRAALVRVDGRREIESAVRAGALIRVVDEPPFALLIVDRSIALVAARTASAASAAAVDIDPPASGGDALLVHPGGLQESLFAVFDRTWSVAEPVRITESGPVCGDPAVAVPCPDDLRLLTLLLDGLTDEAIATKLDLGTRTVQRRVRELIEAAGARTRLQLIWQATRHGWI
jgi:sugar-specific transcriptional regulator TrmB